MNDAKRNQLERYFAEHLGEANLAMSSWRLASQGMSDETIFATFRGDATHELVLRRHRDDGVAREITDLERQFRVLRALAGSGIPIAEALWYEADRGVLDAPFFVMRRVAGHVPVPWSPEGRAFLERVGDGPIGDQFVDVLARIHAVDWRRRGLSFLPGVDTGAEFASREVSRLATLVRRYARQPEPIFEDALGWLAAHAPTVPEATLVHGDYRTGNMIYDGDRIAAVLDWEFAMIGDPMLDVGWVCARSNRMDSDRVCYLLSRDRFIAGYREATGRTCDEERLRFWELYHQVKNAMIWLSADDAWQSGRTRDLRLARWTLTLPTMRRLVADLLGYP